MSDTSHASAQNENPGAASLSPVFDHAANATPADTDRVLANEIAHATESPQEAAIDAANSLRSPGGRTPQPEDFAGLLTPAGNSGDIVGSDIDSGRPFVWTDDGDLGGTTPP